MTEALQLAEERIKKYVELRKTRRGIDIEEIHGFDVGCDSEALLKLSDLQAILAALAQQQAQGEPVAWCELTPSGKIAYFDGRPMFMPGRVGNDCHTVPLYTHPAPAVEAKVPEDVQRDAERYRWIRNGCHTIAEAPQPGETNV